MTKVIWLAVGFMIVLGTPLAFADFETEFSYLGATITVDDTTSTVITSGGASTSGSTIAFLSGFMTINNLTVSPTGTTGGYTFSGTFVNSNSPAGGCCSFPAIGLNSFSILNQSGTTGTLTITSGDTGFTLPSDNPTTPATLASSVSAVTANTNVGGNATVGFTSFLDTTNAQFGTGQGTLPISMNFAVGQTSFVTADVNAGTTPFSLTDLATITLANGDTLSGLLISTTVTTVPEPSTWLLLGAGLAGLAAWRSRKLAL